MDNKLDNKEVKEKKTDSLPVLCSQRWILSYLFFWGFFFAYSLRVNFSVAIVCMSKSSTSNSSASSILTDNNITQDQCGALEYANFTNERAEFDWSRETRSSLLSAFFWGYFVTQIPGGWLADKFGGRRVYGTALAVAGIATVLIPVCARTHIILLYILRVICGLAMGTCSPSATSMWGRWGPRLERTKLTASHQVGSMLGTVVTFSVSGVLCESGFDNGWGSIFYLTGGLTLIWVFLWFFLTRDTPNDHPRISVIERNYIITNIEYNANKRTGKVPWVAMAKSVPLWAIIIGHTCSNWGIYTIWTSLPEFMKNVLKFDIKANGALSAIPYICGAFMAFATAHIADFFRSKKILTTTQTRRSFQTAAFIGAGIFLIATGFVECEKRGLAVVFLCLALLFTGFERAGYAVNHIDIAPKYGGILYGITNTIATIPGMVAPVIAGELTPNDTSEEWRNVFYVTAAFYVLGAIIYCCTARGEIQPWALDKDNLKETELFI
ncbi:sialin-like [Mytilus galloprovincialis]|uniref:sialin-like n=1 Tax=Mytilus galloprovincialis TaxID=29158 RepID=UPI003F7C794E